MCDSCTKYSDLDDTYPVKTNSCKHQGTFQLHITCLLLISWHKCIVFVAYSFDGISFSFFWFRNSELHQKYPIIHTIPYNTHTHTQTIGYELFKWHRTIRWIFVIQQANRHRRESPSIHRKLHLNATSTQCVLHIDIRINLFAPSRNYYKREKFTLCL